MFGRPAVAAALAAALSVLAGQAQAVPFSASPPDLPGPFNGGSQTVVVNAPGASAPGAATLTFDLIGYLSVDSANCCTDTFTLTINGTPFFQGGFDMGGGGTNFVNFTTPGVTIASTQSFGFFDGGLTQFSVTHTLLQGNNTYLFDYGSMQGLGDEGWGIRNLRITGEISAGNVPEPASLTLFGIALAGLASIRRRVA